VEREKKRGEKEEGEVDGGSDGDDFKGEADSGGDDFEVGGVVLEKRGGEEIRRGKWREERKGRGVAGGGSDDFSGGVKIYFTFVVFSLYFILSAEVSAGLSEALIDLFLDDKSGSS